MNAASDLGADRDRISPESAREQDRLRLEAAELYASVGDEARDEAFRRRNLAEAAQLFRILNVFERAAAIFVRLKRHADAAESFAKAEDHRGAGNHYWLAAQDLLPVEERGEIADNVVDLCLARRTEFVDKSLKAFRTGGFYEEALLFAGKPELVKIVGPEKAKELQKHNLRNIALSTRSGQLIRDCLMKMKGFLEPSEFSRFVENCATTSQDLAQQVPDFYESSGLLALAATAAAKNDDIQKALKLVDSMGVSAVKEPECARYLLLQHWLEINGGAKTKGQLPVPAGPGGGQQKPGQVVDLSALPLVEGDCAAYQHLPRSRTNKSLEEVYLDKGNGPVRTN